MPASMREIADVAGVVEVGVGAEDGAQTPAVGVDERCQAGSVQLGVAGVDEHHVPVGELIDGQQGGGGHRRPGVAQNVQKFHGYQPPVAIFYLSYYMWEENTKKFVFPLCKTGEIR